jgi:hypothetical protein
MGTFSCSALKAASAAQSAINCFDDRGLFFLQIGPNRRYLMLPKSDTAPKKSCIHRTPQILIRGPWGRQNYFKPKRWYLVLAASGASDQDVWGAFGCNFSWRFQWHHWRPCPTSAAGDITDLTLCRGSCFFGYTAENSHHLKARIISKNPLFQEEKIPARKRGRCQVT